MERCLRNALKAAAPGSNPQLAAANADQGWFVNYGASGSGQGGGGHTEFTAKYGSPTAGNGTFLNCGSAIDDYSSAGHTIFSVSISSGDGDGDGDGDYFPTAAAMEGELSSLAVLPAGSAGLIGPDGFSGGRCGERSCS